MKSLVTARRGRPALHCDRTRRGGEGGYALIFALAVMVVILIVGMRYLAVVHSRQKATGNEKDALQASLLAESGLERVLRQLSLDLSWNGAYSDVPLAGGSYSARITNRDDDYIDVMAAGTYDGVTRARMVRVYTPDRSGTAHLWATCYGTGKNEWEDEENLIDSAEGETGTYAYHRLGDKDNEMSLAGLNSDIRSVVITKVEIVISGYVSRRVKRESLGVCWILTGSGTSGHTHTWPSGDLNDHTGLWRTGRMYLDVTDDPPPGGWSWERFYHGTDLELRFTSSRRGVIEPIPIEPLPIEPVAIEPLASKPKAVRTADLYVDCAGFRITWGE